MAYDSQNRGPQRPMVDVSHMNLTCATCGTPITELPFEPQADRPVYCRDCNRARRKSFGGPGGGGPRRF